VIEEEEEEEEGKCAYHRKQGWHIWTGVCRIRLRQNWSKRPPPQRRTRAGPAKIPDAVFLVGTRLSMTRLGDDEVEVEGEAARAPSPYPPTV